MKYIRYIFSFFLALSLSAISNYRLKGNSLPSSLSSNNVNIAYLVNNTYSKNSFINLIFDEGIEVFSENNKVIYLTENDIYLMSQIVYAESKGEPFEGKIAVASVILNRVLSPQFPNTIEKVIFQPYAFSCVVDGKLDVVPTQECFDAVYQAIRGNDPTGEALFFYNPDIATCSWMQEIDKVNATSIGQHLFFSL